MKKGQAQRLTERKGSAEDKMLMAVVKYLESRGWLIFVISTDRILYPLARSPHYELTFRFTGTNPPAHPEAPRPVEKTKTRRSA